MLITCTSLICFNQIIILFECFLYWKHSRNICFKVNVSVNQIIWIRMCFDKPSLITQSDVPKAWKHSYNAKNDKNAFLLTFRTIIK